MHVLFVFNHPAPYKVRFFNELSRQITLSVIFERLKNSDRDPRFYRAEDMNFDVVRIKGLNLGRENHFSTGIAAHLRSHAYDLIVMNGWRTYSEMLAICYLKKHRIPYVFYINGGIIKERESQLFRRIKTYFIGGADLYFSPDANSNYYLVHYGAEPSRIINYPYSTLYEREIIAEPLSSAAKRELRLRLGIDAASVFVSCGQFIPRKNYLRLIAYWKKQPRDRMLIIIGGGKEKAHYQRLIAQLDLHNVVLLNFMERTALFEYFRAADAFIFPSKEDIYGHVINEAMSQGLPVISNYHVNSSLHLIRDGENGFVIDIDDDKAIDAAIEAVLTTAMGGKAIASARENTFETMAKIHADTFKEWVNKK